MVQIKFQAFFVVLACALSSQSLNAFVVLSGPEEAKLQATPEEPDVGFVLTSESPPIEKKEEYANGQHAGLSDAELWPIIVQDAMSRWNRVPSAFVNLTLDTSTGSVATFEPEDRIHSIVIGSAEFSSAALASPQYEDGIIYDCDIKVASRSVEANDLLYTLVHELGHCLGLGHNHTNYGAIMGYSRDAKTSKLGADDIAGITYLYPHPDSGTKDAEEMIACGTIQSSKNKRNSNQRFFFEFVFLMLPLLLSVKYFARK